MAVQPIRVIDSHTAGEPTRVVVEGGPDLGGAPLEKRLRILQQQFDGFRRAVVCEPRGSDVLVGALVCKPTDGACATGVIFFNNVGYLGMCGHGLMGVIATLAHLKHIHPGEHTIETPVGAVTATLHDDGCTSIRNVPSYRLAKDVTVSVDSYGKVTGDVAWGGNWFFLVNRHRERICHTNLERLTAFAKAIRRALEQHGVTGKAGAEIDHIELFGPPMDETAHSKNFVLCPGGAYDRSPCGTGTSAKIACLVADGKLAVDQSWRQEGILGTIFEARAASAVNDQVVPCISGRAFITAEATLLLDSSDPFRFGIASGDLP